MNNSNNSINFFHNVRIDKKYRNMYFLDARNESIFFD